MTTMPDLYEIPDLEWVFQCERRWFAVANGSIYWVRQNKKKSWWSCPKGGAHSEATPEAAMAAANAHWKSRMASALRPVKLTMRIDNMNQPVTPFIINGAPDAAGGVG